MKRISFFVILSALSLSAFAATPDPVLKAIDSQVSFLDSDFTAQVTITQDVPGQATTFTVVDLFRRDKEQKYVMLTLKPEVDKGRGYLKVGEKLWVYDPVARRFTVTSARDRFQNSSARNSDFTQSTLADDYKVTKATTEKLGKLDTKVYELTAVKDGLPYPRSKIWVTADNLVRKTEDYSLSGDKLRTTVVPNYQKVGTHFVPVSLVTVDHLRGDKTQLTIANPGLSPLPDRLFTQTYLETAGR